MLPVVFGPLAAWLRPNQSRFPNPTRLVQNGCVLPGPRRCSLEPCGRCMAACRLDEKPTPQVSQSQLREVEDTGMRNFVRDQRGIAALVVLGGVCQFASLVLAGSA